MTIIIFDYGNFHAFTWKITQLLSKTPPHMWFQPLFPQESQQGMSRHVSFIETPELSWTLHSEDFWKNYVEHFVLSVRKQQCWAFSLPHFRPIPVSFCGVISSMNFSGIMLSLC